MASVICSSRGVYGEVIVVAIRKSETSIRLIFGYGQYVYFIKFDIYCC